MVVTQSCFSLEVFTTVIAMMFKRQLIVDVIITKMGLAVAAEKAYIFFEFTQKEIIRSLQFCWNFTSTQGASGT